MRTHVVDHPLVAHKLTTLRDEQTDSPTFRRLADELVTLLAYAATRDVRVAHRSWCVGVHQVTSALLDLRGTCWAVGHGVSGLRSSRGACCQNNAGCDNSGIQPGDLGHRPAPADDRTAGRESTLR